VIVLLLTWSPCVQVAAAQPAQRDKLLLVTNRGDDTVSIFKAPGAALTLATTLAVGQVPRELCVSPDGNRAYILNWAGNSVSVIDLTTLKVTATITHPKLLRLEGCDLSPDSKTIYVTGYASGALLVISAETNQVLKDIPTGAAPSLGA